ncbi:MAG: YARHG domain-containing protein [Leptolyngbyaceae cyanobacterium bins.349]|nr:YARHG domain-containing protein [Leptolyngbyaceae cyanobacterium bins.349]
MGGIRDQRTPPLPGRPAKPEQPDTAPDYQFAWLSERIITPDELEGRSDFELDVMRNSLFARHGLIFVDRPDLQTLFETQSWYKAVTPHKQAVYDVVTHEEWRNYEVIKKVQSQRGQ